MNRELEKALLCAAQAACSRAPVRARDFACVGGAQVCVDAVALVRSSVEGVSPHRAACVASFLQQERETGLSFAARLVIRIHVRRGRGLQ